MALPSRKPTGEISMERPASSLTKTLNDSGISGSGILRPLIMDWKARVRPSISSDLRVNIS